MQKKKKINFTGWRGAPIIACPKELVWARLEWHYVYSSATERWALASCRVNKAVEMALGWKFYLGKSDETLRCIATKPICKGKHLFGSINRAEWALRSRRSARFCPLSQYNLMLMMWSRGNNCAIQFDAPRGVRAKSRWCRASLDSPNNALASLSASMRRAAFDS
jgi:hypothetical protein